MKIKPLSVNDAWKGRRYKSDEYKRYEHALLLLLPKIKLPEPPYRVSFEFGFSNTAADFDNPVKPLTDILQKKYGFNDKEILEATIRKINVIKGQEYFKVTIENLFNNSK